MKGADVVLALTGERETARFIQSLGLQGILVQRIMKRYGTLAKEKITKDPYYALRGITGIDLRQVLGCNNVLDRL